MKSNLPTIEQPSSPKDEVAKQVEPVFDEFSAATPEDWRAAAEPFLKGAPFEKKLVTRTPEGIALQPIYFSKDAAGTGNRPPKFGGLIAQEISAADPDAFNRALRADFMAGQNCTPLPLSAKTCGLNARAVEPPALTLNSVEDLRASLNGVDLVAAPLIAWTGTSALPFLGMLAAHARQAGLALEQLSGAILADPLTACVRSTTMPSSLSDAFDQMAETVKWARRAMPGMRVVGVAANEWADAGASAVDELAFAIAAGVEYVRQLCRRGIEVEESAGSLVFQFSLGSRLFMEIAKLRASRRLWARIVEAFGGDPESVPMVIHGRSSRFVKATLDPHTNLLRTTADAFAGIVGGVDALTLSTFDEFGDSVADSSRRIARNIPVILAEECGLADVADAAGGSWFVEKLTNEFVSKAWSRFQEIESLGGLAAAICEGHVQELVAVTAAARFSAVASGRENLVGVNFSANPQEIRSSNRTDGMHDEPVDEPVAAEDANSIASVEDAVAAFEKKWTLERVRAALIRRKEAASVTQLGGKRLSEEFEALRRRTTQLGETPGAWLATFGAPRQHRARADFSSAFLACGGIATQSGAGAGSVDDAVREAIAANLPVVVVCSTDETYPDIVPAFAAALKNAKPSVHLLVAGSPGENESAWRAAGVDGFIHLRVNRLEFLDSLISTLSNKPR